MKLTLRELFLLVALVAMGCGWWMDHLHLAFLGNLWQDRAYGLKNVMELKQRGLSVEWQTPNDARVTITGP
jgi:hypothetical protein